MVDDYIDRSFHEKEYIYQAGTRIKFDGTSSVVEGRLKKATKHELWYKRIIPGEDEDRFSTVEVELCGEDKCADYINGHRSNLIWDDLHLTYLMSTHSFVLWVNGQELNVAEKTPVYIAEDGSIKKVTVRLEKGERLKLKNAVISLKENSQDNLITLEFDEKYRLISPKRFLTPKQFTTPMGIL